MSSSALVGFSSNSQDGNGRVRVASACVVQRIDAPHVQPLHLLEGATSGTGVPMTFNTASKGVVLQVGAGTGTSTINSRNYVPVDAGASFLFQLCFRLRNLEANVVNTLGWYDSNATGCQNGFALRVNNAAPSFVWFTNDTNGAGSSTTIAQASWNLDPRWDWPFWLHS